MDQEKPDKWRKLCRDLISYTQDAKFGTMGSKVRLHALEGNLLSPPQFGVHASQISAMLRDMNTPKAKSFIKQLREFY